MPVTVNVAGNNKATHKHVSVAKSWRPVKNIFVYLAEPKVWRPVYSYEWYTGPWKECSTACGGGVQLRDIKCRRNDGQFVIDQFCY